jgi:hypothetical protein
MKKIVPGQAQKRSGSFFNKELSPFILVKPLNILSVLDRENIINQKALK